MGKFEPHVFQYPGAGVTAKAQCKYLQPPQRQPVRLALCHQQLEEVGADAPSALRLDQDLESDRGSLDR